MKEHKANDGTILFAAVLSMCTKEPFEKTLKHIHQQAGPEWHKLAQDLKQMVVNKAADKLARGSDQ